MRGAHSIRIMQTLHSPHTLKLHNIHEFKSRLMGAQCVQVVAGACKRFGAASTHLTESMQRPCRGEKQQNISQLDICDT